VVEYVKPDMTTLRTNLDGVLYTSNAAVQVFRTQEIVQGFRGKIVLTGSVA
jgi:NAD(P)-dependent dehydrogenase (short-subunit alcohol dehydrogenase family)